MRIAQVATVCTPVRAEGAGSVESLVHVLARELTGRGHEVTVFATGDSAPPCELVAALPGPYADARTPDDWQLCEWINVARAIEESSRFDVVHSHSYLNALPLLGLARSPVLSTTHVLPYDDDARLWEHFPDARLTAISGAQWERYPHLRPLAVIPHGVDPAAHLFAATPGEHLLFLGRFTPGKGPLDAIAAARALGLPLRMAGPRNAFYDREVAAHVDGARVRFEGPVGGARRDALLGGARVLLYPVREPEPFGLVMVEAMMSGTPVAAYGLGAVPEIVEDGVTGAIARPGEDLAGAVRRCLALDRRTVRARAEERFASPRMVEAYERVYERLATAVPA